MPVPPEIRAVERPKNTIVEDRGRDGPKRYAVRERGSIKCIPGRNPQPHNGKVIGFIIDGKFVPSVKPKDEDNSCSPDMLSYGSAALVKSVSSDLLADLLKVYDPVVAYTIMSIASIKVIRPGTTARRMSTHYARTFISVFYPGASISLNSIGTLYKELGSDGNKRQAFYKLRLKATSESHHIAIDGTLKQDTSTVNDLSSYSYKARKRSLKEISVFYAYDIERMEPICAEVFPGNCIDATSYCSFIKDNDIRTGIIVADKGFPPSKIKDELVNRPNLHFLTPIKRNDKRIANNNMLEFQGVLDGIADNIRYCKRQIQGGNYLYAFRDADLAAKEENTKLNISRKKNEYDYEDFSKKEKTFGLIVLESDLDLDPLVAYKTYSDRWLLELVFKRYKSDECLDLTNNQGDFSVIGAEFVNFISTVITARVVKKIEDTDLLKEQSFADVMDDLSSAWRKVNAPSTIPETKDEFWVHTNGTVFEALEKLGISKPIPKPVPKRRGRPPKNTA